MKKTGMKKVKKSTRINGIQRHFKRWSTAIKMWPKCRLTRVKVVVTSSLMSSSRQMSQLVKMLTSAMMSLLTSSLTSTSHLKVG